MATYAVAIHQPGHYDDTDTLKIEMIKARGPAQAMLKHSLQKDLYRPNGRNYPPAELLELNITYGNVAVQKLPLINDPQ